MPNIANPPPYKETMEFLRNARPPGEYSKRAWAVMAREKEMAKQFIPGSKEWVIAYREGAFKLVPSQEHLFKEQTELKGPAANYMPRHWRAPSPPKPQPRQFEATEIRGHGEDCTYCGREMIAFSPTHPTRDHVVPRSRGGTRTVLCCTLCNNMKGEMMPDAWARFRRTNPQWWKLAKNEIAAKKAAAYFKVDREPARAPKIENHPLVRAVLDRFPGAEVVRVSLRGGAVHIPKVVPKRYDDPQAQAAFEAVYRDRLYMLRS